MSDSKIKIKDLATELKMDAKELLQELHADLCMSCGTCSFVCPAKRPVTQMMSLAKAFYLGEIKKGGNK